MKFYYKVYIPMTLLEFLISSMTTPPQQFSEPNSRSLALHVGPEKEERQRHFASLNKSTHSPSFSHRRRPQGAQSVQLGARRGHSPAVTPSGDIATVWRHCRVLFTTRSLMQPRKPAPPEPPPTCRVKLQRQERVAPSVTSLSGCLLVRQSDVVTALLLSQIVGFVVAGHADDDGVFLPRVQLHFEAKTAPSQLGVEGALGANEFLVLIAGEKPPGCEDHFQGLPRS